MLRATHVCRSVNVTTLNDVCGNLKWWNLLDVSAIDLHPVTRNSKMSRLQRDFSFLTLLPECNLVLVFIVEESYF